MAQLSAESSFLLMTKFKIVRNFLSNYRNKQRYVYIRLITQIFQTSYLYISCLNKFPQSTNIFGQYKITCTKMTLLSAVFQPASKVNDTLTAIKVNDTITASKVNDTLTRRNFFALLNSVQILNSVQKFIEIQGWQLLIFFKCLHKQLSSFILSSNRQ